jgi:membrane protein DedA with SNARE-associated domain
MQELLIGPGSYLGIVAFLILTGCGLPIPEEVPIVMVGVLSAQGAMLPSLAFLSCLIGAIVGDCVMYAIGYHFGHNLLKDHPKLARFVHANREARFEQMIDRHGLKVLFAARFMVGVRSPVYLSAGILRVSFRRFLMMDLLCATSVVGLFFGLAYVFGEPVAAIFRQLEIGLTLSVLLLLGGIAAFFFWRHRRCTASQTEATVTALGHDRPRPEAQDATPVELMERRRRA